MLKHFSSALLFLIILFGIQSTIFPQSALAAATCTVDPTSIKITDTFNFEATGLEANKNYSIKVNGAPAELPYKGIPSGGAGIIKISVNLQALTNGLTLTGEPNIVLFRDGGSQNGTKACETKITLTTTADDIPKDQKYYRCDNGKGNACVEYTEFKSGSVTDKTACDQACKASGTSVAPPVNTSLSCSDAGADPSKCTAAGAGICDTRTGEVVKGALPIEFAGVSTSIGCIPTSPQNLIGFLLLIAGSAGGGIALLLMIFASFKIIMSAGNPESIKQGRQQFTAAVIGLLFILFSVILLRVLGADILNIPGFG